MATKSYAIANFSQISTWTVSEYPQYNFYFSEGPTLDTDYASVVLSDIPAGSTINSAYLQATLGSASTGAAIRTVAFSLGAGAYSANTVWDSLGPPATESINVAYLSIGGTTNIKFRFQANGTTASRWTGSSSLSYSDITLNVDYTPPTAASVSNVKLDNSASNIYKGAGTNATLSWTGTNGTNNAITSYSIYSRDNGGAWTLYASGITAQQATVAAHSTAGSNRQFYVVALAPYGNSADVTSPVLYSYSAVSVPGSVAISPASGFPNDSITLSWTASSAGVGTTVTGYQVLENGVAKATVSASPYVFSAPAAGSYTYTVIALASVTGYNSAASAGKVLTVAQPMSSFTLNTPTVAMDGTSTIIATILPSNPAYNHDVKFELDATRTSMANVAAGATTRSFAVPLAWCAGVPNATSATARCTVTTKNGSTIIGSTYRDFTVTVPASVIPTVSLSVAPVNGFNGIYLKGKSSCTMTAAGSGVQGSTITARSLYGGGHSGSASPFTTGLLNTVGVNVMTAVVTDSRNRQSAASLQNITVVDYAPPVISAVSAFRSNSGGTAQVDGTYIAVKASLVVSTVTGNSGTATVRMRVTGGTWGTAVAIMHNTTKVLSGAAIANGYQVEITLTDTVGTVSTYAIVVNPAQFMFDFRMDRAGIGRLASEANKLVIPDNWTTNIDADKLDGYHVSELPLIIYPVGVIYISTVSTSPATLFGGTWSALGGRMLIGVDGTYTNGLTGGSAEHNHTQNQHRHTTPNHAHTTPSVSLTEAQMPQHTHAGFYIAGYGWLNSNGYAAVGGTGWDFLKMVTGNQTGNTGYTGSGSAHGHGNTGNAAPTTDYTTPTNNAANGMPPFLAVYMWKRTA